MDNIILQINASCELDITVSSNWWISLSSSALLISFFTSADNTIMKLGLDPYVHVLLLIWRTSFSHHLLATQTINWFFFSDPMIDLLSLEKKKPSCCAPSQHCVARLVTCLFFTSRPLGQMQNSIFRHLSWTNCWLFSNNDVESFFHPKRQPCNGKDLLLWSSITAKWISWL